MPWFPARHTCPFTRFISLVSEAQRLSGTRAGDGPFLHTPSRLVLHSFECRCGTWQRAGSLIIMVPLQLCLEHNKWSNNLEESEARYLKILYFSFWPIIRIYLGMQGTLERICLNMVMGREAERRCSWLGGRGKSSVHWGQERLVWTQLGLEQSG